MISKVIRDDHGGFSCLPRLDLVRVHSSMDGGNHNGLFDHRKPPFTLEVGSPYVSCEKSDQRVTPNKGEGQRLFGENRDPSPSLIERRSSVL